jgi:hypothetical protein
VADSTRDADADVIVSGREPRRRALRPGGLLWLLVVAQAAVLAVTAVVAVHYRAEAGRLRHSGPQAASLPVAQGTAAPFRAGQAPCAIRS